MKKIFSLMLAAIAATSASAQYVSPGTGKMFTFEDLASIGNSGVIFSDGAYVVEQNFTISNKDTLRLQSNDVIKLGDKVEVIVEGVADFAPVDTATVTRVLDSSNPKGFRLRGDGRLQHVTFEYVGVTLSGSNDGYTIENCTFKLYNGKLSTGSALTFSAPSGSNVIRNCYFVDNIVSAISSGANMPVGVIIDKCHFLRNTTGKSNRPQINLTCGGDYDVIISNNTVIGIGEPTLAGGIGVSNMLNMAFSGKVVLKNNRIENNRYGIAMIGAMNLYIEDNYLLNNKFESNPQNGGSGISLYNSAGGGKVFIKGNHIENSFWGITIIGRPEVNAGKNEDRQAADYNPGENVFVNNGNNDHLYDLYNNGPNTVYAQGNKWNVTVQDSASIEEVVTHKVDNNVLGEVIFMPAWQSTGINTADVPIAQVVGTRYFNLLGFEAKEPFKGINIVVTRYSDGTIRTHKVLK